MKSSNVSPNSHWEQSDIRGDVAAGWGEMTNDHDTVMGGMDASETMGDDISWDWRLQNQAVHNKPQFYPLDPHFTRRLYLENNSVNVEKGQLVEGTVEDTTSSKKAVGEQIRHSITDISHRISNACQHLSIQASWDNRCPSATLFTMERVEMVISMFFEDISTMGREKEGEKTVLLIFASVFC